MRADLWDRNFGGNTGSEQIVVICAVTEGMPELSLPVWILLCPACRSVAQAICRSKGGFGGIDLFWDLVIAGVAVERSMCGVCTMGLK